MKKSVLKIATHPDGTMDVDDLEKTIQQAQALWKEIFMINATAGTTVLWAYDNLEAIAAVAKHYGIWLHVDMIRWWWVLLSQILRYKIQGIEHADSLSWNPHKMLGANMQCSIFMTQRPDLTATCNVLKTQYLFQSDKWYDIGCDTWDKYTQCGRRVDILKLRLLRRGEGNSGVAYIIEQAFEKTNYLVKKIMEAKHLYLYHLPQCTNINFWYIPEDISLDTDQTKEHMCTDSHEENLAYIQDHYDRIHSLTAKIKDLMLAKGEMMTWYASTKWFPNFFRMILISPQVNYEDLDFVVEHIQELGKEILS